MEEDIQNIRQLSYFVGHPVVEVLTCNMDKNLLEIKT